ncbi:MAG: RNA polymerase sigma factor [Firmicutes bacterium]|nr:RNA polymerase sigma factor [[Eubacterium] siraeum]MCM1488546.1 RNA polymerase sigma factor [Bacillota bacterium]
MDENNLLQELKKGSTQALSELIVKYTPFVSSVIVRILPGRKEDTEELCEDVFVTLWENRQKVEAGKIKAYLAVIARNKAFSFLRKNCDDLPLEEDILLFDSENLQQRAEQKELAEIVSTALHSLGTAQRELFVRHYYYGQAVKEAAAIMGINESTAKSWLKRGREKLKEVLLKSGFDYDESIN